MYLLISYIYNLHTYLRMHQNSYMTVLLFLAFSSQDRKLPFPNENTSELGTAVPNLASAWPSSMLQAEAACLSAHFPFCLVIRQKDTEFPFTLSSSALGIFSALGEKFSHL